MPAFVVVALGVNATSALVISQVVLSIALPLPMIALLIFTGRRDIMGAFANSRLTRIAALIGTAVVLSLNVVLIAQTLAVARIEHREIRDGAMEIRRRSKSRIASWQSGREPCSAAGKCGRRSHLHRLQIFRGRLAGLAVHHDFEGNALTFPQLAEAGAFDGADMDEHVLTTTLGLDESIALLRVEPLHGTVVHGSLLIDMHNVSRAIVLGSVRSNFW